MESNILMNAATFPNAMWGLRPSVAPATVHQQDILQEAELRDAVVTSLIWNSRGGDVWVFPRLAHNFTYFIWITSFLLFHSTLNKSFSSISADILVKTPGTLPKLRARLTLKACRPVTIDLRWFTKMKQKNYEEIWKGLDCSMAFFWQELSEAPND